MARGGRTPGRWLTPLLALLALTGCMSQSGDPALEATAFDASPCPDTSDADRCFLLRAEVDGMQQGRGQCDVVAVDSDGANLATGASYGPLALAPGRSFEWLVEVPAIDDPAFAEWIAACRSGG